MLQAAGEARELCEGFIFPLCPYLKENALRGWELVQSTARLAAMNLMLHGIGSDKSVPIVVADALAADPGERFEVVLANPPFGKKSSTMITGAEGHGIERRPGLPAARRAWRL